MIISALLTAVVLASGPADPGRDPPSMRVAASGLDLSTRRDAAVFAGRVVEQSRRFCAEHIEILTPERLTNPRLCERGMADAAVRALPEPHRRAFARSGGVGQLYRRQR